MTLDNKPLGMEQPHKRIVFFGIECLVEKTMSNMIKITCDSMEDAESIVRNFWEKRDPEVIEGFNRGMLKPEHTITSGARTMIIEYGEQIILIINENDLPLSEKTISALEDGGFSV